MAKLSAEHREQFGKTQSAGNRAPNMRHGDYLLMIDDWRLHYGYMKKLSDIHNFVVLRSNPITVRIGDQDVRESPNEVWSRTHATFKWADAGAEMGPINSMRFLLTLMGISDEGLSEKDKNDALERLTNEDPKLYVGEKYGNQLVPSVNPCRGMIIGAETAPQLTKKSGKWIVVPAWRHIAPPGERENSYEAAAKRWAEYEARLKQAA